MNGKLPSEIGKLASTLKRVIVGKYQRFLRLHSHTQNADPNFCDDFCSCDQADNALTGTVPSEMVNLTELAVLDLSKLLSCRSTEPDFLLCTSDTYA